MVIGLGRLGGDNISFPPLFERGGFLPGGKERIREWFSEIGVSIMNAKGQGKKERVNGRVG